MKARLSGIPSPREGKQTESGEGELIDSHPKWGRHQIRCLGRGFAWKTSRSVGSLQHCWKGKVLFLLCGPRSSSGWGEIVPSSPSSPQAAIGE